jgi:DNA-binding transcriptional regulator GbsR (MarR family)
MNIIEDIDKCINNYLDGNIANPLLKKVIEEEIYFSDKIKLIFKKFLSDLSTSENFNQKLDNLSNLIRKVSPDTKNILKNILCNSFIELSSDQHIFFIMNMNDNIKNIFELLICDPAITNILKYIISGLIIGINNEEYVIKCIDVCLLINKNISTTVVNEYVCNNSEILLLNDKLLSYFINYIQVHGFPQINLTNISKILECKIMTIKNKLDNLSLNNMDFAFEIYKLGKIIVDSKILYYNSLIKEMLNLKDDQIEYIVKSIHTCIINKNLDQAKIIISSTFLLSRQNLSVFIKYYNKSLLLRINDPYILLFEYNLWNINSQYKIIMNDNLFLPYLQIINNIKYSQIINIDMNKIKIKNLNVDMTKVNVTLVNHIENNHFEKIVHHKLIQQYVDSLNKYIVKRSTLQNIYHDMEMSKIKIKTSMGTITCSLTFGSILLYLNDSDMSISELSNILKINEDEVDKRIKNLIKYNIVIKKDDKYKYIPPYGNVECKLINLEEDDNMEPFIIKRFTDIELTTDARIIKEIKPNKMNIMELERRVQEYMGDCFVRNIFYDRLDSLKKRFYIIETNSIIEYIT